MSKQLAMSMPTNSLIKQFALGGEGRAYQENVFDYIILVPTNRFETVWGLCWYDCHYMVVDPYSLIDKRVSFVNRSRPHRETRS